MKTKSLIQQPTSKRAKPMRITYGTILAGILLLATHASAASDCKAWLPLLPATFDGIPPNGQTGVRYYEDNSCLASQRYLSEDFARAAVITIAQGERAGYMDTYVLFSELAGKDEALLRKAGLLTGKDETLTWETISGYKTVMHIGTESKRCTLYFSPRKGVLLILEVDPMVGGKEEMLRLGKLLPLAKLAKAK